MANIGIGTDQKGKSILMAEGPFCLTGSPKTKLEVKGGREMKKILVFIGLKVTEIAAVIFIPYFVGLVAQATLIGDWLYLLRYSPWVAGITCLSVLFVLLGGCAILIIIVLGNWKWATKLIQKR